MFILSPSQNDDRPPARTTQRKMAEQCPAGVKGYEHELFEMMMCFAIAGRKAVTEDPSA
ncbi:hypothetical protein [Rhizobium sp. SGZ-381]|uniref:hypothetical protein n=1 Tax=Rhizobium sp. SGZ-381 TaxID=3342800 RepID=UPI00366BA1AB